MKREVDRTLPARGGFGGSLPDDFHELAHPDFLQMVGEDGQRVMEFVSFQFVGRCGSIA